LSTWVAPPMVRLALILALLLMAPSISAALLDNDRVFIPVDDGGTLSGKIATALVQDQQGFIWIGTQQGLVRYDGYQFTRYRHDVEDPTSLGANYVRSLALAADGRVWVGTLTGGVSIYDPANDAFQTYAHAEGESGSLSNNRVDALASDASGGMWVGTNAGLDYWHPESNAFIRYHHRPEDATSLNDDRIRSLLIDRQGDLWVGSWNGLNRRRAGSDEFTNVAVVADEAVSLAGKNVLRLFQDDRGLIWFGTPEHGGGWLEPDSLALGWLPQAADADGALSHPWVTGIAQSQDNRLWIATYGGGVNLVDLDSRQIIGHLREDPVIANGIGSDEIGPLLVDDSGLLWVGTWGAGLRYCNVRNQAFRMLRPSSVRNNGLSPVDVMSIMAADDGTVWVGTAGNGIDILDMQAGVIGGFRPDPENPRALAGGSVTSLAQSANGDVWVGTRQSGLHRQLAGETQFTRYTRDQGLLNNYVHRILPVAADTVWVGTSGGLNRFDPITQTFSTIDSETAPDQPFEEQIDSLVVDRAGTVWVAAESGLYVLPAGAKRLRLVPDDPQRPGSLAGSDVNGLLVDRSDRLWLSTASGLTVMRSWDGEQAQFDSIAAQLGLLGAGTGTNLLEDNQGRIWSDEASLYDPQSQTVHRFGLADGIDLGTSWIRSYAQLADGRMLYGGSNGIVVIDSDQLSIWDYEPPLVITEASIDSRPLISATELVLAPGSRSFSVGFAALDYTNPLQNRYAFRLEPYDSDWIATASDRRIATYTNLDPGSYQLRIRGSNRLGTWSTRELAVSVIQQPSWYQTIAFRTLAVLIAALALYLTYRWRVRQLHAAQEKLHAMVQSRTAALEQALSQVEQASQTDSLTGLRNRRYVWAHIEADVQRSAQAARDQPGGRGQDLVFFLFDIDRFKAVNDMHGHAAGDAVLVQFAALLRVAFRPSDVLARWGGEEFLVVSRFVDRADAAKVAERVRSQIQAHVFELPNGRRLEKTCSIGYAAFPWLQAEPELIGWEQVVDVADVALLAAKRSQRNAWVGIHASAECTKDDVERLAIDPGAASGRAFEIECSLANAADIGWS